MKVLQIYKDYYPPVRGGIEGHINLLANGLKKKGIQTQILVSNTNCSLKKENINGIFITKVPQLGRFTSAPINFSLVHHLKYLAKDADILHFHFPNPTAEISCLISRLKHKIIVTYHSDIVRQATLGKIYKPFMNAFLSKADTILTTSPNYLHSSKILKKFHSKCQVVPLGIDLSKFFNFNENINAIKKLHNIYKKSVILFIGKFRYYKGLHVLIRSMKKIDAKLLLIGTGPLKNDLQKKVMQYGLAEKVIFTGEVSNSKLALYLHLCDIFVLPSIFRSEAFGVVQLEAMACGKPVICTELNTGTSFVNQHNQTGLVIPPFDDKILAKSINFLLTNPEIREKYGKEARRRVEQNFSVETMVDKIISIYQKG